LIGVRTIKVAVISRITKSGCVGILIIVLLPGVGWNESFKDCRSTDSIGSIERILKPSTSERRRLLFLQILYSAAWDERYARAPSWRLMVKCRLKWRRMCVYLLRRKYGVWWKMYGVLLPAMLRRWLHQAWRSLSESTCNG